jgi:hypothetical protein
VRIRGCGSCRKLFLDVLVILSCLTASVFLRADGAAAAFDLVGPKVDVRVERAAQTLPIAEVPNLQAGDRLWIHPDLPDSQSVHYLMVVVFLRGATNPPPEAWFTRAETWTKPVHEEGIHIVVPQEAEQALILLAPETGGAFSTLRSAVRGKPGAFVRAAQDLEQLCLDRLRLQAYLDAVRETSENDPEDLKSRTTLLARSLNIKLDQQCFDKPSAQQVPCLTQNTEQLVLDDAHSQNMVATLTTGAPTDLLAQISSTPTARSGYYSPYVGAVVDVVRILGTTHTAQYQYIPALAQPKKDTLNLRLNNPPSFRNPKSVLVIGLPPVRQPVLPPLRAVNAKEIFCADKPGLLLPADGAPLVFATDMAHKLALHIETSGEAIDLPVHPDAARGGFVVESHKGQLAELVGEFSGKLHGDWGFGSFDGPQFRLRASRPGRWIVASKDASALIVGRKDLLHLQSEDACCVSGVQILDDDGKSVMVEWKTPKPDELEVSVPLENAAPGSLKMLVSKFGLRQPDEVSLYTYAEAGRLDGFTIHAGDADGILRGTRLDQVMALDVNGIDFAPRNLTRANQHDELRVEAPEAAALLKFEPGEALAIHAKLKDGRTLDLKSDMEAARPKLTLLSKSIQLEDSDPPPLIHLTSAGELPQRGRLNFSLKAQVPENFAPNEKIEVATADESFHVLLSVKDGNLTLQDAKTIYGVLDPMKLLGPSAFGPLKFRAVSGEGVEGDWQPLVNLVRMPELKGVRCVASSTTPTAAKGPAEEAVNISAVQPQESSLEDAPKIVSEKSTVPEKECALTGDKLFLIDAVSVDPDFANPVTVPDGFIAGSLTIPQPKNETLYIKLRDDPGTVDTAVVPMLSVLPNDAASGKCR